MPSFPCEWPIANSLVQNPLAVSVLFLHDPLHSAKLQSRKIEKMAVTPHDYWPWATAPEGSGSSDPPCPCEMEHLFFVLLLSCPFSCRFAPVALPLQILIFLVLCFFEWSQAQESKMHHRNPTLFRTSEEGFQTLTLLSGVSIAFLRCVFSAWGRK